MVGNIDIKVRPLKLAYLVDPNKKEQVREAIRLSSTLWGGVYFPIIPLYKRMPKTWRDPAKAPEAKKVIVGCVEAFDPDALVQFSKSVPDSVANLGLQVIKPADVWDGLGKERNLSPKFGIGIFELLRSRFTTCVPQSGVEMPYRAIKTNIADSLNVIVQTERRPGSRSVSEVLEIQGYDAGDDNTTSIRSSIGWRNRLQADMVGHDLSGPADTSTFLFRSEYQHEPMHFLRFQHRCCEPRRTHIAGIAWR